MLVAHQLGPSLVHRMPGANDVNMSVLGREKIGRGGHLTAVAGRHASAPGDVLLGHDRVGCRQRCRQQGSLNFLTLARGIAVHDRGHGAEGAKSRRAVINPRTEGFCRLVGRAAHDHVTAHRLRYGVEPDFLCIGADSAECGVRNQNDVRLDRLQAVVIEAQPLQRPGRHVRDHHVGGCDQLVLDGAAFGLRRV